MSANDLMKALSRVVHTREAVAGAILIALSLSLAGCGTPQPVTTTRLIPPPRAETPSAHESVPAATQPETLSQPAQPAQPAPLPVQRISETKPPPATINEAKPAPATASKGAERLMALNTPAVVRAREKSTPPAEPPFPKAPTAEVSGTVTDAPVQALIVRGPPPQAPTMRVGIKVLLWLGLGLGAAALAVLARFYAIRRATPAELSEAGKDDLKPAPGLLLKEPLNLPQKTAVAEKA